MPVMDEFKEEREKLKEQPLSKRLSYFWTYYKWYVIGGLVLIIAVGAFIKDMAEKREDELYCAVVNGYALDTPQSLSDEFAKHLEIDTDKYSVTIDSSFTLGQYADNPSLSTSQYLAVYMSAGDIDAFVMDPDYFLQYAYAGCFYHLTDCLDAATLEKLSGKIIYVDAAAADSINQRLDNGDVLTSADYTHSTDPSTLTDPVAVGIDISDVAKFTGSYYYKNGVCYFGIVTNAEDLNNAVAFLTFLLEE